MIQKSFGPRSKGKIDKQIALALQGGGALGSYQAGVYEALAEHDYHPDLVTGISIGAINCAIIAGNAPADRVARLRQFWELVSSPSANWLNLPQKIGRTLCGGRRRWRPYCSASRAFSVPTCGPREHR